MSKYNYFKTYFVCRNAISIAYSALIVTMDGSEFKIFLRKPTAALGQQFVEGKKNKNKNKKTKILVDHNECKIVPDNPIIILCVSGEKEG